VSHPAADRLLAPLSDEQQWLVDVVFEALDVHNVWPTFHYVERRLQTPALAALIASFPTIGGVHYSAVWAMSVGGVHPADQQVGLTIAGLAHATGAERYIELYLRMLRGVAARLVDQPLHPAAVTSYSMNYGDLVAAVALGPSGVPLREIEVITRLIRHEPATWHGGTTGEREDWRWTDVPWHITRFGDVKSVEDYLEELAIFVAPVATALPPTPSTPASDDTPDGSADPWTALLHRGLHEHIADLVEGRRWGTAVREAAVYLEHELRRRGRFDTSLVGLDLVTAAMKPGQGPLAIPPVGPAAEQEGWHALARGFVGAVRNRFAHTLPTDGEQLAAGAVFTASLILVAMDTHFPSEPAPS
jgi:hypothetical protein